MFSIIDSQKQWNDTLKCFKNPDCYYSFEYGTLFSKNEDGKLFAAFFEDDRFKVFYPFIKRRVPFVNEDIYDIVTPYGYGGPLVEGIHASIHRFYELFSSYCRLQNIITETIRFHPLYGNDKFCEKFMKIKYIRKTTAVDLTISLEEIRNNYSTMNKRNIKKAKNNHLTCYVAENTQENIKIFMDLYKETMDRNHASTYYYFDKDYFSKQVQDTDLSETVLIFSKKNNVIIAGVMVLVGKKFSHYHLGASRTNYLELKPNNLLFDYMIEFCKKRGSQILHLGGGYQEDDGLFKFKTSFTNNNNYEYLIGENIHDPEAYSEVINSLKNEYRFTDSYFPLYRGKMEKKSIQV